MLSLLGVAQQGLGESAWYLSLSRFKAALQNERPSNRPSKLAEQRRIGADRWEPFQAVAVLSFGEEHAGIPASPGVGCGRLCFIDGVDQLEQFRPRDVVVTTQPVPNLAPLLWDAAGLVTLSGGPGAHLFEAARSLNVPAVSGIGPALHRVESVAQLTGRRMVAVDGDAGRIYLDEW
jgi:phosphoenolpyruvate synthase/pyruvate phosphate dikinase